MLAATQPHRIFMVAAAASVRLWTTRKSCSHFLFHSSCTFFRSFPLLPLFITKMQMCLFTIFPVSVDHTEHCGVTVRVGVQAGGELVGGEWSG